MMMMHPKAPTDAEAEAPTYVWWDINRCPVPADVDARMVGPCIKSALNKLGYTGPVTITAIGILTEVPLDVLRAVYSTGIALHHVPTDRDGIAGDLFWWAFGNSSYPTNFMLISGERIFGSTLANLESKGYNIIRSICSYDSKEADSRFALTFTREGCFFLWKSLLSMLRVGVLSSEGDMCSELVESTLWCSACRVKVDVKGFECVITHLNNKEHSLKELLYYRQAYDSYENLEATTIQKVLTCLREDLRVRQRKAEQTYSETERKVEVKEEEEEEEEEENSHKAFYDLSNNASYGIVYSTFISGNVV